MPLRRKPRRKLRRKRVKRARRKRGYTAIQSLRVRTPGAICPDRMFVKLRYYDSTTSGASNVGNNALSFRYRPSAAYDINPLLGTTAMAGFNELAALYGKYRVHASKISMYMTNQEDFSCVATLLPLNEDPGAAPGLAVIQGWQMQPFSQRKVMAAKGGMDKITFSRYISTKKLVGSNAVKYESDYSSIVSSVPNDNWYWVIGVTTMGTNVFTTGAGVEFDVNITCYIEFYDRLRLPV